MPRFTLRPTAAETIWKSPLFEYRSQPTASRTALAEGQRGTRLQTLPVRRHAFGTRWTRRRRAAAICLALSSGLAWRWYDANLPPTFPPASTEMTPVSAPNATHFYAAAADALTQQALSNGFDPENTTPAEQALFVRDNLEALALLRQGMRYPYLGNRTNWMQSVPAAGLSAPSPSFLHQRTLSRLLLTDARVMAMRGDAVGAVNSSIDGLRFGVDIGRGDSFIAGMIGLMCEKQAGKEALMHVADLSAADARAAVHRLESILALEQTYGEMIVAEKRFGLGTLQEMFAATHPFSLSLSTADGLPAGLAWDATLLRYGKGGIVDNYATYMDEAVRRSVLSYQEAKRLTPIRPAADPLSGLLAPDFSRARLRFSESVARDHVLLARLAVQAYYQEHSGTLPASLTDLTTGATPYLLSVPEDPFSATGQEPLRYADGNVYSVGENGVDDGGTGDDDPATW
jgi:hypothetical protein